MLPPNTPLARVVTALGHPAPAQRQTASSYLSPLFPISEAIALQSALALSRVTAQRVDAAALVNEVLDRRQALIAQLHGSICGDEGNADGPRFPLAAVSEQALDKTPCIDWFQAHQRILALGARRLRLRVRETLSQHSAAMARLAALDEQFEHALQPSVRAASASLRQSFDARFPAAPADQRALTGYAEEGEQLLCAELDWRLAPVFGLLQALTEKEDTSL